MRYIWYPVHYVKRVSCVVFLYQTKDVSCNRVSFSLSQVQDFENPGNPLVQGSCMCSNRNDQPPMHHRCWLRHLPQEARVRQECRDWYVQLYHNKMWIIALNALAPFAGVPPWMDAACVPNWTSRSWIPAVVLSSFSWSKNENIAKEKKINPIALSKVCWARSRQILAPPSMTYTLLLYSMHNIYSRRREKTGGLLGPAPSGSIAQKLHNDRKIFDRPGFHGRKKEEAQAEEKAAAEIRTISMHLHCTRRENKSVFKSLERSLAGGGQKNYS